MSDKVTTYATCSGCRWYLRIVRILGTRRYCTVCAPHAHMLPITSDGVASVHIPMQDTAATLVAVTTRKDVTR